MVRVGMRFGAYEITGLLGVGGMGEVYRATDTNLGRDVAIKILPPIFAGDADRVARFRREAEALAALNHPNIAQIHGLERDDSGTGIVLELVDGPTLAERISRGPISVDEAIGIAMQLADALEAAHGRGVVHRDLKPDNIKLRPDGTVKVLDFGIATAPESGGVGSRPPTLTQAGAPLGTTAYMSPEQARGRTVDGRADIWAFGCVLYEMLTGQPAFAGEEATTTVARVLEREVDMRRLPRDVGPAVQRTLELCLAKDAKSRIADIRDVRLALSGAFVPRLPVPSRRSKPLDTAVTLGAAAIVGAAVTLLVMNAIEPPRSPLMEMRLEVATPDTSQPLHFALAPNGRNLAFVAVADGEQHLWLRSLGEAAARPLRGTEGARNPFWSPDSRWIAFFTFGALQRVNVASGTVERLAGVANGIGGSWNDSGTIVFATGSSYSLSRIDAPGGPVSLATQLEEGQAGHRFPEFLPDGRRFLFYVAGEVERAGIFIASLDGGVPRRLTAADSAGRFLAPDWLLFVQQGTLLARRLDLVRGELIGDPVIVSRRVGWETNGLGGFSVSASGQIALRGDGAARSHLVWRDRGGTQLGTIEVPDASELSYLELSSDSREVAAQRATDGDWDLWSLDLNREGWRRLTRDPANDQLPIWSPDGTRIIYSSNRSGHNDLYIRAVDGTGAEEAVVVTANPKQPQDWSRDGRFLLYYEIDPVTGRDLWLLDFSTGAMRPVANSPSEERAGQFSSDGRWIAYETDASGEYEVVVQPFPDATRVWPLSARGGRHPRWSADGSEVFYVSPDDQLLSVPVMASAATGLEVGRPVPLFPVRFVGGIAGDFVKAQYAVARDGRFLFNEPLGSSADGPIEIVLNWNPEETH